MDRTYELILKAQNGDKESLETLLNDNASLIHSIVRKLIRQPYEYEDLFQIGSIGFIKAIKRFDTSLGLKLSTYAFTLIVGEIKKHMRDDNIIKVSRSVKEVWQKTISAGEILKKKLGRDATIGEISDYLNIDKEKIVLSIEAMQDVKSLNEKVNDDVSERTLEDTISSSVDFDKMFQKILISQALDTLEKREKKVIILRYFKGYTQTEVSSVLGVSQVQVSRIEKKVLSNLKKHLS